MSNRSPPSLGLLNCYGNIVGLQLESHLLNSKSLNFEPRKLYLIVIAECDKGMKILMVALFTMESDFYENFNACAQRFQ